jgi:hypothetical protein
MFYIGLAIDTTIIDQLYTLQYFGAYP